MGMGPSGPIPIPVWVYMNCVERAAHLPVLFHVPTLTFRSRQSATKPRIVGEEKSKGSVAIE